MAKMWAGRFKKDLDSAVNAFNSSISFDYRLYKADILGSKAHAKMLEYVGIISEQDLNDIHSGLDSILADIDSCALTFDVEAEDIHMFVEAELTKRVGDAGKRLHTARSRNDQVALDIRLYLMEGMHGVLALIEDFIKTLVKVAKGNVNTIMPGYTHLQRAQPITFAHHLLAYVEMLIRDKGRVIDAIKRCNSLPLGACALATTTHPIDRFFVARELGFDSVMANSLDAVSDRDFCIEMSSALSIIMVHLSRLSEEVILWCSHEFKFIELDDAFATGSSIMPQKKNPDITELVRGKAARVFGDTMTLLTVMKGLPLAYNKDMQEDKEAIFDALDTVTLCLKTITPMFATMKVNVKNMRAAAERGFINATDCADYLAKKGVPFRDAYKATGEIVAMCIDKGVIMEELPLDDYKSVCQSFDEDIFEAIKLETCLNNRAVYGGPSPKAVAERIAELESDIEE